MHQATSASLRSRCHIIESLREKKNCFCFHAPAVMNARTLLPGRIMELRRRSSLAQVFSAGLVFVASHTIRQQDARKRSTGIILHYVPRYSMNYATCSGWLRRHRPRRPGTRFRQFRKVAADCKPIPSATLKKKLSRHLRRPDQQPIAGPLSPKPSRIGEMFSITCAYHD